MSIVNEVKNTIDEKEKLIESVNQKIWEFAELAFQETKSMHLYLDLFKKEGFEVKTNLANIPTAFQASYGNGYPVIAILGEFDALPGLSQKSGIDEKSELVSGGSGHGCGHNSLGAASFGAVLAIKEYMSKNNLSGTVRFLGCPAEESGYAKTFLSRDGILDDVDAAFTWHPSDMNRAWSVGSLANLSVGFSFYGKTSHAAAAPHLGRSALDSAEIMSVGVNYLREHIIPDARVHYAYEDVGGSAPNVVQSTARVHYYIRAPKNYQVQEIFERVKDIAKGAALICGTETSYEIYAGVSDFIPNRTLTTLLHESMVEVGAPEFSEEDFKLANKFYNTLNQGDKNTVLNQLTTIYGHEKAKEIIEKSLHTEIEPLVFSNTHLSGSTDVGDVSYVVPTAQMTISTIALGTPHHTWQMTAQGNTSIALKGVKTAAASMALATIKLLNDNDLIEKSKEDLKLDTNGEYICPIPSDLKPKLDQYGE